MTSVFRRALALLCACAVVLTGCGAPKKQENPGGVASGYSVIELQRPSGYAKAFAYGINNSGQVAGYAESGIGIRRAVVWDPGKYDAPRVLGDGQAWAINEQGQVAGQSSAGAVLWGSGGMVDMKAGQGSAAYDVNDMGIAVGRRMGDQGTYRAFMWMSASDTTEIDSATSEAHGVNAVGKIVGWRYSTTNEQHACTWQGIYTVDLSASEKSGVVTKGVCINDNGDIVLNYNYQYPVLLSSGASTRIGSLYPSIPALGTYADGINNSREIVGRSSDDAFVWQNGTTRKLRDLAPTGTPWLWEATAINDKGQIVCLGGVGQPYRAFLLTPKK